MTMAMIVRVILRVIRPSSEPVTDAPHGGEREIVAELLSKLPDVDIDRPFITEPIRAPHPIEQLLSGQCEPGVFYKEAQRGSKMTQDSGTIVVIEDDPDIADLLDLYLRRDGYRVLLASDGLRGIDLVRQNQPKMVILDVGLPGGMDGLDVCRTLRATSSVAIMMLTARDTEIDRILGLEMGADDYVTKPF